MAKTTTGTAGSSLTIPASKQAFTKIQNVLNEAATANTNVLLRGMHGVGKTKMILSVCEEQNLRLKYFSASTLDPFADLVGIPVPSNSREMVRYLRPEAVNKAQFMFFDELNRAHKRVTNAVFEIIQFRSINNEPLPDLRMVWAAVNPWNNESYDTEALDEALQDRFPILLDIPYLVNFNYFEEKYGADCATICFNWWAALSDPLRAKCSPRRLEYIIQSMMNLQECYREMQPFDTVLPLKALQQEIEKLREIVKFSDIVKHPQKFIDLLKSQQLSNDEASSTIRVLANAKVDELVKVFDVALAMPPEYMAKIVFRDDKYGLIRKEVYTQYGLSKLVEYDRVLQERLLGHD